MSNSAASGKKKVELYSLPKAQTGGSVKKNENVYAQLTHTHTHTHTHETTMERSLPTAAH